MKFQWSKISALLGDYKDFIKAYDLSIQSTGFSEGQIAAQMDTLTKKFEQFKATLTGLLTQGGSAGFTGFLKEMLDGITHAIKGLESIPKSTFETIGSMAKWGVIALGVAKAFSFLNTSITAIRVALKGEVAEEAADTVAKVAETAATEGLTVATIGLSQAVTVASAGLNLVIAAIATAVVGYGMYSASVGEAAMEEDAANEKMAEAVDVKKQEAEMSAKQEEQIGTLGNAYVRLTQHLEEVKGNEQEEIKTKKDIEATETELTKLVGEDGLQRIKTSGDIVQAVQDEQNAHHKKTEAIKGEIADLQQKEAEAYANSLARIDIQIQAIKEEGHAVDTFCGYVSKAIGYLQRFAAMSFKGIADQGLYDRGTNNINYGDKLINGLTDSQNSRIAELKDKEQQLLLDQDKKQLARDEANVPTTTGGDEVPDASAEKDPKGSSTKEVDNTPQGQAWRFFKSKGLSDEAIAGIMGNIETESSFDPNAYSSADGGSYGLGQWTVNSGRYQQLVDSAGGEDEAKDFGTQLSFMWHDLQQYPDVLSQIMQAKTPEQAAYAFSAGYEKPAYAEDPDRQSNARKYYDQYGAEGQGKAINIKDTFEEKKKIYEIAYQNFEAELEKDKNAFLKNGQLWTANDTLALFNSMMGQAGKGVPDFTKKQRQFEQEKLKQDQENQRAEQESVKKHLGVLEQMSDVEEKFLHKHHAVTNREDINYRIGENEKSWYSQAGQLQGNLTNTAFSPQAQEQMLSAWNEFENARTEADAKAAYSEMMNLSKNTDATKTALKELESAYTEYAKKREDLEYEYEENARRYQMVLMDSFKSGIENGFYDILTRTKSFAEAMRDIFKNLWNSLARQLSSDISQRIAKAFTQVTKGTNGVGGTNTQSDNPILTMLFGTSGMSGLNSAISQITSKVNTLGNVIKSDSTSSGSVVESNIGNILSSFTTTSSTVQSGVKATSQAAISGSSTATTSILSNLATISWQMIAVMVVMELLSKLLGSGSSKKTSTSSVSLGRNPGTYYVTPSTVSQIPSYDVGTLNVPEDTLAMVHKGESIFPASVAENIRKSGGVSGSSAMTVSSTFSPNLIDSRGIKDVYHESTQDLAKEMKSIYRRFASTSLA